MTTEMLVMSGSLAAFMCNTRSETLEEVPHYSVVSEDIYSRFVWAGISGQQLPGERYQLRFVAVNTA